jgi:hypothetical protein
MWIPPPITLGLAIIPSLLACGTDWKVAQRDAGSTDGSSISADAVSTDSGAAAAAGGTAPTKEGGPAGSSMQSSAMYELKLRVGVAEPQGTMSSNKYTVRLGRPMEAP